MIETLKLMFNISHFYPQLKREFTPAKKALVHLLVESPIPAPTLQTPITSILNALMNLDLIATESDSPAHDMESSTGLVPHLNSERLVDRLILILDTATRSQTESELDQAAMPLCTLIRLLFRSASPQIKLSVQRRLLPDDRDRSKPLGQGDSLASRLLRMSNSPHLPTLGDNISALLFELSDRDASRFINNVGYGFASGFLMKQNIQIPSDAMQTSSEEVEEGELVNPITGQKLSAEDRALPSAGQMTEEEKEREAERLFVLFERLRATGVVDVKNPVQEAIDQGRFEELD